MSPSKLSQGKALLLASHFGPTLLVVSIAFSISLSRFSLISSLQIAVAFLAGQFVVGWSNEIIDYPLDQAAGRQKKPLVSGDISLSLLKKALTIALLASVLLSLPGPLGVRGTLVHLLAILSATLYNVKLKSTLFSPIPYLVSFSAVPWAIYLAAGTTPPLWLYLSLALFTTSFHFLNILKDLEWDISQGVLGMPQRFGRKGSIITAAALALVAILVLLFLR